MDQFDKKIRKGLANGPKHEPDWGVWDKIAPHLTQAGASTTTTSWIRPVAVTAALLVLAGLFYWLGTMHANKGNLEAQMEKLAQTIAELQKTNNVPARIIDTIVVRDTVWYIYNTAGQWVALSEQSQPQDRSMEGKSGDSFTIHYKPEILKTSSNDIQRQSRQFLEENYTNLILDRKPAPMIDHIRSTQVSEYHNSRAQVVSNHYLLLDIRKPLVATTFQRNIRLHPYHGLFADQIIKSEKSKRFWKTFIPDRVRAGALLGGLNPTLHEVEHTQEWVAGIQMELLFSPRISILTGLRYRYLHYKREAEFEHSNFPIPADLQAGDRLKELYSTVQYFNLPLLVKYSYPLSETLFPYVQTGILIGGANKQDYKYEVIRDGQEKYLNTTVKDSPWIINSYLLGLGIEYNPSSRITLTADLEGRYHFQIPEVEYDQNHGLGMRLGLYYSF